VHAKHKPKVHISACNSFGQMIKQMVHTKTPHSKKESKLEADKLMTKKKKEAQKSITQ